LQRVRRLAKPQLSRRRVAPVLGDTKLTSLRIDALRFAIRANQVSFPSQVPTFGKHDRPDLQWKFAQLYFVRGWSCEGIVAKYGLIEQRVRQILNTWKRRAVEMGYIQFIPPADAPAATSQPVQHEFAAAAETFVPLAYSRSAAVAVMEAALLTDRKPENSPSASEAA
jgi:hypothetical protein